MHPLLHHIHPTLRTGLLAWALSRAMIWLTLGPRVLLDWPQDLQGSPLWAALLHASSLTPWPALALGGVLEVGIALATLSAYVIARKELIPQVAERATWLFALCPAWVLLFPPSPWTLAAPLVVIASGLAARSRLAPAALVLALAIAAVPHVAVFGPGVAALGWRHRLPDQVWSPWALILSPWAALCAVIFSVIGLGGHGGVSMRSLHDLPLREAWEWRGVAAHTPEFVLGASSAALLLGGVRHCVDRNWWWFLVPALALPWIYANPLQGAGALVCAAPAFACLARALEAPALERPALVSFLLITLAAASL